MALNRSPGLAALFSISILAFVICGGAEASAPPVDEIKALMVKNAFKAPSAAQLAALNSGQLERGLAAIDPYARYILPAKPSKKPGLSLGLEIFSHDSLLWVRPDPHGPADRAGIPEIGILSAINGKNVERANLDTASALLDTAIRKRQVKLTVARKRGEAGKNYSVSPARFSSRSFSFRRFGPCVGVRINEFAAHDTAPGLVALYETIVPPGTKVIIDLRGCTGGDLPEAVEIAGMFAPSGKPLLSKFDRNGAEKVFRATVTKRLPPPALVIIDGSTASAAEVFAGILKHYKKTRLIGRRTFGKSVSQEFFPLSAGGGLWLTTHRLRLPDGKPEISGGLVPDILVNNIAEMTLSGICSKYAPSPAKQAAPRPRKPAGKKAAP